MPTRLRSIWWRMAMCVLPILMGGWGIVGVTSAREKVDIKEFGIPCLVGHITSGPDGNLWFTEESCGKIGRITPSGSITEFSLATRSYPNDIVAGPDGSLWFTEINDKSIGRITTAGSVTTFPIPGDDIPMAITVGPDGNLWFTMDRAIGRITPAGTITLFPTLQELIPSFTTDITIGPDGNLWFTGDFIVGYITPAGAVTILPIASNSQFSGITAGPDGNLWVMDWNRILRVTPAGQPTSYDIPDTGWGSIIAGPDGNLWFSRATYPSTTDVIGRITLDGKVTVFPIPDDASLLPMDLTRGPDGNLWYTHTIGFDPIGSPINEGRIGRLRISKDKQQLAANVTVVLVSPPVGAVGPDNLLSYTLVMTNRGKGAALDTAITLPFDPRKVELVDATFDRSTAWVSEVRGDALIIKTGSLGSNGDRISGIVRFRRSAVDPAAGLHQRLTYTWRDTIRGGAGQSNLPTQGTLGPDHQSPWYPLAIAPSSAKPGSAYHVSSGIFVPREPVGLWYNTPAGAAAIATIVANSDGTIQIDFTPVNLAPGYYSVVTHGLWSEFDAVAPFAVQ